MSNVIVDKQKIDILANAIADKSGVPVTMTLDEMKEAVDGIEKATDPRLQSKAITVSGAGTSNVSADSGYDGLSAVAINVPSMNQWKGYISRSGYATLSDNKRYWLPVSGIVAFASGWLEAGDYLETDTFNAVPANTTVAPTESAQTIGGANYMMEGAVTVSAIPSSYVGSGITRRSSSDMTASGATITAPAGYYSSAASKSVSSGTAGTPTATKGTVSNHSISVTPSVTNTSGYITGSTKTGTAVSVSASELVSGSQTITQNGTVDVTNLAEVVVAVEGGSGGGGAQTDFIYESTGTATNSRSFTGLKGEPIAFHMVVEGDVATGTPAKIVAIDFDGTSLHGQTITNTTNAQVSYDGSSFAKSYSNGTLTVTSSGATFSGNYSLSYAYGASSSSIDAKDVQVGSGATSITFTGLEDEPIFWSCIFKSNFSTSSGYQRVITVADLPNTGIFGFAMDSSAHANGSYWTSSYANGSLTITSNGTNAGGYFHQPGYYQLTAVYGGEIEPTEIEVEPLSVTQNGTYTAPTGKAYSPVTVNVSGGTINVATTTWTNSDSTATSHTFTGLLGTPKAAFLRCTTSLSRSSGSSNYYVADMRWTGTATAGNSFRRSNGTYANVTSGYSFSASGTSLTVTTSGTSTSNPGSFYNGTYELVYIY